MEFDQAKISAEALRPIIEILDALDLHFCLHWIIRDCQIKDKQLPASIMGSVIQERHYALNWFTTFENADWDDVDTPT